ncbi:MAG: hypothetical protein ACFCD0_17960 [Gemmataceae bacterium]
MRAVIILLVVVAIGGAAYVGIYHPDWIWPDPQKVAERKREARLATYKPANTPHEAAEYFAKAIRNRDYEAAARYVTSVSVDQSVSQSYYAEKLRSNHKAVKAFAEKIGELKTIVVENQLKTPIGWHLLLALDPFPTNFEIVQDSIQPWPTDKNAHSVQFSHEAIEAKGKNLKQIYEEVKRVYDVIGEDKNRKKMIYILERKVDRAMFLNGLMPPVNFLVPEAKLFPVPSLITQPSKIVSETDEDEEKTWKLEVAITPEFKAELDYFLPRVSGYRQAVENLIEHAKDTESLSADDFEKEMIQVFGKQIKS